MAVLCFHSNILYPYKHSFMKSISYLLKLTFLFLFLTTITAEAQKLKFDNEYLLWKNGAPGSNAKNWPDPKYKEEWLRNNTAVIRVTEPTIRVFHPAKDKNTGIALIICPGGGYNVVEVGHEGYQVAEKLQEMGITAVVLKYRHYHTDAALQDAHRAVRFVRSKAKEWGIDENKVGIGGFSAGGHLSLNSAANLQQKEEWEPDAIDKFNKKPDFLMLIYADYRLSEEAIVDKTLPPTFLSVSADDQFHLEEPALLFFHKLLTLKVPAELHIYQKGGHGYGLGWEGCQCNTWPTLFFNWLKTNNIVK